MKICEEVLARNPNHAEAMVWHGGGLFLESGSAFRAGDLENARTLLERANIEMDRAVELQPDSVAVRAPRGAVLMSASRVMPPDLGGPMLERALRDYEHVLKLQAGRFASLGEHPRGELLFGLAEGSSRAGHMERATALFSRIVSELPNTVYAKRAAKWLETKTLDRSETGCVGCHARK
jgi:hypothetical protein